MNADNWHSFPFKRCISIRRTCLWTKLSKKGGSVPKSREEVGWPLEHVTGKGFTALFIAKHKQFCRIRVALWREPPQRTLDCSPSQVILIKWSVRMAHNKVKGDCTYFTSLKCCWTFLTMKFFVSASPRGTTFLKHKQWRKLESLLGTLQARKHLLR